LQYLAQGCKIISYGKIFKRSVIMSVNITKEDNELIVRFPYSPDKIVKIKSIKGYKWHVDKKVWTVPYTEDNIKTLKALFKKELQNFNTFYFNNLIWRVRETYY
jgi:hypothetical protein